MKSAFFGVLASSILFSAHAVIAGPFGIEVDGFSLEKYSCSKADGQYYICTSLPSPHNDFEQYIVRYHLDAGLCSIKGIGKNIDENGFGSNTKSMTDSLYGQISKKYGKAEKMDFLFPSSIWNEGDEWLMGLVQDERSYAYIGDVSPPVEGITKYGVIAGAVSGSKGYVIVEFQTTNYDKCDAAEAKDGASSF
jgi:hypothetical protein